ncbi:MAG: SUMF1/EgtB/PvdO family nonheme iron enzyme [Deltaproteobacteria bacterium]|nr:SUMF1/EgtB/PvdO family nonheme iron enzyme [Deltaproteobacteria bacterium]
MKSTFTYLLIVSLAAWLPAGCGSDDDDGAMNILCPDGTVGVDGPEGPLCVDVDEITNTEAVAFLDNNGSECSGHPCIFLDEPGSRISGAGPGGYNVQAGYEEHPVVQITWHGARSLCESQGTQLCPDSTWTAACSGPTGAAYPYGDSYDPAACNGTDAGNDGTVPTASMPTCEGGLSGLYDMSGNVYEWTDACADGPCLIRGGSFDKPAGDMACDGSHEMDGPSGHREDLGLRCCSTPL